VNEPVPTPSVSRAGRAWAVVLGGSALALLLFGGAREGFRPLPSGRIPADTPLPVGIEPSGNLDAPPSVFRWTPGGPDVDFSQVLVFDERFERVWQSAPVADHEIKVDPARVFARVAAGAPLSWSVREVRRGRPRATSAAVAFTFAVDVQGRGIGESLPGEPPIRR
jgi:hypothetical protein